jgi:hypothetical protein
MSKTETLLSALRDIHEPAAPESVSVWLLAANIALLAVLVGIFLLRRNRLLEGWRRAARRDIEQAKNSNTQQGVFLLATLLRKIAILRNSSQSELQGDAWLEELDTIFSTQWFTQDHGRLFGAALYKDNALSKDDLTIVSDKVLLLVNALPSQATAPAIQP